MLAGRCELHGETLAHHVVLPLLDGGVIAGLVGPKVEGKLLGKRLVELCHEVLKRALEWWLMHHVDEVSLVRVHLVRKLLSRLVVVPYASPHARDTVELFRGDFGA